MDPVLASFGLAMTERSMELTCTGEDGEYIELEQEYQGDIVSLDPRLSGVLTTHTFLLINTTKLVGTGHGTLEIRDPVTGNLKITGFFDGVILGTSFKG